MNKSTKHYNGTPQAKSRREKVIERLETQLKKGMKPPKKTDQTLSNIPLTDIDIKRIEKEIEILKQRI
jgi:hypothetical protein